MLNYTKWQETAEEFVAQIADCSKLKNSSILVSGATGMIGSAVMDILIYLNESKDYQMNLYAAVRNIEKCQERFSTFYQKEYFHIVSYDAGKPIDFDFTVDYVIQAASNADPAAISTQPAETLISNVYGVWQILEYVRKKEIKRMLFVSTGEIYGKNTIGEKYKENDYGAIDILNYRAAYPVGKRAAENLCASYVKEYNIDIVIARLSHAYGPTIAENDSRASAQFTHKALKKENIVMKSAGQQLRSYCYVYDSATAMLTVLLKGITNSAYNVANTNSVLSIKEIACLFAKESGTEVIFEIPSDAEKAGYNLMDMSVLDATALEKLGWNAVVDAKRGVAMTLDLMK